MKKLAISSLQVACAALVVFPLHAQGTRATSAPRTRVALARALRDSVKSVLSAALSDKAFPGAYVVVGDSRGVLTELGAGRLDWSASLRPTARTLWDVASLTKVVGTITALAQLMEQGRVELDAPVQRYLPDWTGAGKELVTVRHLLTHTSGLPAFKNYDQQTHNADSIAALLFATALERKAGEKMVYSDIGAFMMGRIVERVSGRRLDRYLAAKVFGPLHMTETMFNPPRALRARIAPTEVDSTRGGLMRGKVHDERAYYLGGVAAHAGLFSTGADLARFATMLLHGGSLDGARILRAETIRQFTAYADSVTSNRALGWQKPPAQWSGKTMSSGSFGHTGFTGTSIAVEPSLDLYIILLSNRVNPTRANTKIGEVRPRLADAIVPVVRLYREQLANRGTP